MRLHRLRLLVIDDQALQFPPDERFIEVVSRGRGSGGRRIGRWYSHCRSLAEEKELRFDMLSVDINFEMDKTDPYLQSVGRKTTCAGLYHGMMALACRESRDESGNRFPLAWEVRTISPREYAADPALKGETVRAYGLLRGLAARPLDGESLESCVRREYQQFYNEPMETPHEPSLADVMAADLSGQSQRHGAGLGIVERLLPSWRREFTSALARGDVQLHHDKLVETCAVLDAEVFLDAASATQLGIPIASRVGELVAVIPFGSALSDLFEREGDSLDLKKKFGALAGVGGEARNVHEWLVELGQADRGNFRRRPDRERFSELARNVVNARDAGEGFQNAWDVLTPIERSWVFVVLVVYDHLTSRSGRRDFRQLAELLHLSYNDQLFLRPVKKVKFGGYTTPAKLRKGLLDAMQGRGQFGRDSLWDDWLRSALRTFCEKTLEARPDRLRGKAPGLLTE